MLPSCFIAGTDTDVGKTVVTASILRYLKHHNHSSTGLKPIASGFEPAVTGWVNNDVESIKRASLVTLSDELVNSYAFRPAIAPHIAANDVSQDIDFSIIKAAFNQASKQAETVIVEGVGGWRVPIHLCSADCPAACQRRLVTMACLARELKLPVILVVGLKLGCLNHALLTARAIIDDGLPLLGWVANNVMPRFERKEENLETLRQLLPAPLLFELPHLYDSGELGSFVPQIMLPQG